MTSELKPEEALSSGSFSNKVRSTLVSAVELVSIKSSDFSVTFTVVEAVPKANVAFNCTGTEERISASCSVVEKPLAEMLK